jgi:hypothetical protein
MRRRRQKGRYPGFAIKGHSKFANGDRYARRDLMDIAKELGVDLLAGQKRKSKKRWHRFNKPSSTVSSPRCNKRRYVPLIDMLAASRIEWTSSQAAPLV